MQTALVGGGVVAIGLLRRKLRPLCDSETGKDAMGSTRLITVRGTAHERGMQLHALMGRDAAELAASRRALYSAEGLAMWDALAANCVPAWREHAPVAWAELEGRVAAGANLRDLLMLGTDFEIQMAAWRYPNRLFADDSDANQSAAKNEAVSKDDTGSNDAASKSSHESVSGDKVAWGRCTAFAVTGQREQAGLCGQNVDEDACGWRDGRCDAVVRLVNSGEDDACGDNTKSLALCQSSRLATAPTCAVYTHPGVPGYCGMNSAGLCVLDLYIDEDQKDDTEDDSDLEDDPEFVGVQIYKVQGDPRREITPQAAPISRPLPGLPIDVTIRELLAHRSLKEAVAWLEAVPRAAPSTYLLLQGDMVCCVEASARRGVSSVTTLRGPGATLTHSNHALYDNRLAAKAMDEAAPLPSTYSGPSSEGSVATTPHAATAGASSSSNSGISDQISNDDDSSACFNDGGCSSEARLNIMQKSIRQVESSLASSSANSNNAFEIKTATTAKKSTLSVAAAQDILEGCPAAHAEYAPTIARVVLEPERSQIHVKFIGEKNWRSFPVADADEVPHRKKISR